MKKTLLLLTIPVAALLATACGKDTITSTDESNSITVEEGVVDTTSTVAGEYDHKVVVVFSTSGAASVSGTDDSLTATVSNNAVTITNTSTRKVLYVLSGTSNNGYFKLYSGRKQMLQLNNLGLVNPKGAAINIQGLATPNDGKQADVYLSGTNTLGDGTNYALTPDDEDEKAAFFSEGQIVLHGDGTLNISAVGKAGLTSDDWVAINSGCTLNITSSAGHGVRGKNYILVSGGTVNVTVSADGKKAFSSDSLVRFDGGVTTLAVTGSTIVESGDTSGTAGVKADKMFEMNAGTLTITNSGTGGKGISCDSVAYFRGGTIDITVTGSNFGTSSSSGGGGGRPGGGGWPGESSSDNSVGAKGIKCDGNIEISGGDIVVKASSHEGIETKGTLTVSGGSVYSQSSDDAINAASHITISGGYVYAHSTGNDGIDANGNLYIQGGVVCAICTGSNNAEVALDANTESRYKLYIEGGVLLTCGALENGAQLTQSCYRASSWTKNVWYSLDDGSNVYCFKTPSSGGSTMVVSASQQPTVKSSVTVSGGTTHTGGMIVENPTVSGGSSVSLSSYSGGGGWH